MHTLFSEWYRKIKITPSSEMLTNRWQGVAEVTEGTDVEALSEIVRLYYKKPLINSQTIQGFRSIFQKYDSAFRMTGNDNEISLLAGATIAHVLETKNESIADIAALLVCVSNFCGKVKSFAIDDIVSMSETYLIDRSSSLRNIDLNTENEIDDIEDDQSNISDVFTSYVEKNNEIIGELVYVQKLQQEEINILWWLFGEYSRDMNKRISDLKEEVPLVAGKELADLTEVLPGPMAAIAFLDKMLQTVYAKKKIEVSIRTSVNNYPKQLKLLWTQKKEFKSVEDLCPLYYSILKSTETDDTDNWLPLLERSFPFKADDKIKALNLAIQSYRENLLAKALKIEGV